MTSSRDRTNDIELGLGSSGQRCLLSITQSLCSTPYTTQEIGQQTYMKTSTLVTN